MKNLQVLALVAATAPVFASDPNALKQFENIRQVYYRFDPHAYKTFTCHVDASTLDAAVSNITQAIAPRAQAFRMKNDLANYSLTVDSSKGLSFNDPTLDIEVLDEKVLADPAKVRLGIEQTERGFSTQVQGIDKMISSIFSGYLDKLPEVTSVSRDGDKWIVKYIEGGNFATDTIDGPHIHEETEAAGARVVSDSDFTPVSGKKLGLQSSHIEVTQGAQNLVTTMTVNYQRVGKLRVPVSIVAKTTAISSGLGETKVDNTIKFQNCSHKN